MVLYMILEPWMVAVYGEEVDAVRFEVSLLSGVSQTITCMPTEAQRRVVAFLDVFWLRKWLVPNHSYMIIKQYRMSMNVYIGPVIYYTWIWL